MIKSRPLSWLAGLQYPQRVRFSCPVTGHMQGSLGRTVGHVNVTCGAGGGPASDSLAKEPGDASTCLQEKHHGRPGVTELNCRRFEGLQKRGLV